MFLTLNDKQLSAIKRSAVHSAHFQFLNVSLTFSSDSIEAVDIFSAMYQNFMASAQPVPDIMCYIINDTAAGSKPAAVVNGKAYELFEDELFISHAHMKNKTTMLNISNHKSSQLLLTIGDFLNGVECYEMTTGPLNKMAAMIESLYQKG